MKAKSIENNLNTEGITFDDENIADYGFDEVVGNYYEVSCSLHEALYDFGKFSKKLYDINCRNKFFKRIGTNKIMEIIELSEKLDLYIEDIQMHTNNWMKSIDNFIYNTCNKKS